MQLRLYFLNTQVGNVTVNPYIRIDYHQALRGTVLNTDYLTIGYIYSGQSAYAISENTAK